jgi:hypothetical protein
MAIRQLLLTHGRDAQAGTRPVVPDADYYDSTLLLLANLAADENT